MQFGTSPAEMHADTGFKKLGFSTPPKKIWWRTLQLVLIQEMSLCISGTKCLFTQSSCLHIVHLVLLDVERSIQGGKSNGFRRFYLGLPCLLATIFLDYYYYFELTGAVSFVIVQSINLTSKSQDPSI
jgi:hypothetical protein